MKIADPNPPLCSACYNQQPDKLHIDMEVAYDGPVIDEESGIKVTVDDLFLCQDCLVSAYKLLDVEGEQSLIDDLLERLDWAHERGLYLQGELQRIRDILRQTQPELAETE